MTGHIGTFHTTSYLYPLAGDDRALTLLKHSLCEFSGGFGAR